MTNIVSKTKIKFNLKRKTNPKTIDTITEAKKNKSWLPLAKIVSSSTRQYLSLNLDEIDEKSVEGDVIIIPGKVLGEGSVTKKIKICALAFSASALDKMKKSKVEGGFIIDEIKNNPTAKGVKILR